MERLEKLFKKHEMGDIARVDWLDQLVFRAVEKERGLESFRTNHSSSAISRPPRSRVSGRTIAQDTKLAADDEEDHTLFIDLPRFDFPVVFADHEYPAPPISSYLHHALSSSHVTIKPPPPAVEFGPGIDGIGGADGGRNGTGGRLVRIYDPEVGARDNPAESKHRRLVRSHRTGVLDRDLKPNAKIRDELNMIMTYGPTHDLNPDEKDLVWKYKHHLTRDKRALTKFVKSVTWSDVGESRQAVQILPKWTEIDVDDALELLGPTFDNPAVRAYAVDRLKKSDDDELLLYLLQLVQALKFENISPQATEDTTQDSSLANFLITRATENFTLGNYFHWYLMVECDDGSPDQGSEHRKLFARVEFDFMTELEKVCIIDGPSVRTMLTYTAAWRC
jgi:phosphatidylinositol 3-kinase